MNVSSRQTYIKVTLTMSEWKKKPKTEQDLLLRESGRYLSSRAEVQLFFRRSAWQKIRSFFPHLQEALPHTWQNL